MQIYTPEQVGMSSERLARLSNLMEEWVKDNQMPGILTLLQRKGKVIHFGKYGMMDIEAGKPMQEDALFRLFSMTKPITSVAMMMLVEEGRVSLNDLVSRYIPSFATIQVETDSGLVEQEPEMRLHHLITHTSGLGYHALLFEQRSPTLAEAVEYSVQWPLLFQPGTRFSYSCAVDVLGYIIQVVSEMPFADFLEERVFKPLGMTDTSFHVPPEKLDRLAQIYETKVPGNLVVFNDPGALIGDVTVPTHCPSGGAGLVSTLGDYLNFCNCLLNKGQYEGGHLLSPKTLAWMTADHLSQLPKPIWFSPYAQLPGMGLGFRVTPSLGEARVLNTEGDFGWGGWAQTHFWIDPTEEFIGLMMTQHISDERDRFVELFQTLGYQAIVD